MVFPKLYDIEIFKNLHLPKALLLGDTLACLPPYLINKLQYVYGEV